MTIAAPQLTFSFFDDVLTNAKPFLKWAGGKGQLLNQIKQYFPLELEQRAISKYAEPFIGGGAVFFFIASNYQIDKFYISDMNENLILTYKVIQQNVDTLIEVLSEIQHRYFQLDFERQKLFFYEMRTAFNAEQYKIKKLVVDNDSVLQAARLIFLNRTCFNGLYRVNSGGGFNVPFGSYKNPRILDTENLEAVSSLLAKTEIRHGDFTICEDFADSETLIYFDPPYRPISRTASFNSYAKNPFDDSEQARLAAFFRRVNDKGAKLMLSNSDPHNENPDDNFFQELYKGFVIHKVLAKRAINSNGAGRGEITELLITNFQDGANGAKR